MDQGMSSIRFRRPCVCRLQSARLAGVLLAGLVVAGCAQIGGIKTRVANWTNTEPSAPAATAPGTPSTPRLSVIVNDELEHGHYGEGEQALRRYIRQHPDDQQAKSMLRQLTVKPEQMLGQASRPYVVRPGDSYSVLAARFLGDSNLFLILARYNGSTNPSQLSVGQTIRIPTSAPSGSVAAKAASAAAQGADQRAGEESRLMVPPTSAPTTEATAAKAARLQAESVALLGRGQKTQALARLDQAFDLDPRLQPSGPKAASLREQLLANYHQRAVILYRDQKLDPAIALWNHVLAINPGYEPALIYRARALELKQRLKQLGRAR